MADFNRAITYTDPGNFIDQITTFLLESAPGPTWELEAVFSSAGDSFLRTSGGGTTVYIRLFTDGADPDMVFIQYINDTAASNGWDAGTGPAATASVDDLRTLGTGIFAGPEGGSATLIADEERCIVTALTGDITPQTTVYFGNYDSHTLPGNDTYPNIVLSNASGLVTLADISSGLITAPIGSFNRRALSGFPSSLLKARTGDVGRLYEGWNGTDAKFESVPHRGQYIPMDDRASPAEIFAYEMYITMISNGFGESFFLTGMFRVSNKLTTNDTITIGVDDYIVLPMSPDNPLFGSLMIAGPLGTAI